MWHFAVKMGAVQGLRVLLWLHRSVPLQHSVGLVPVQLASAVFPRRLCSDTQQSNETKPPANSENESLLENLNLMGVDVKMARQRQPGVFRKVITNEQGVAEFLLGKGFSQKVIASIISRFPRVITRSIEHLEQRWTIWRNVLTNDEIVSVLDRSPESFFRSDDNENLENNIDFLVSLGLNDEDLRRLLTTAPRTFSNSVKLNKQMVELLKDACAELGGQNPEQFVKSIITRNFYILTRSTKRVRANIDTIKTLLELNDPELLALIEGHRANIVDLSNEYLKKNVTNLQQKLMSLGCKKADVKKLIMTYPVVLYHRSDTLNLKLDCLLKGGITMTQILEKPKVLDFSTQNITGRLKQLHRLNYDFQKNGIQILDTSCKRFSAQLKKTWHRTSRLN